jgi:shikimate kinase
LTPAVVLIGAPGAGKTTVAAELSTRLGLPVRDTDADIVAATGREIADIFLDDGEQVFRALEADAVAAALQEHGGVLSLGGGAVLNPVTRDQLESHNVVFLDVSLAAASRRVGLGTGRPLLLGNVRSRLKALLDERRPLYLSVARHVVRTDDLTPAEVAAEILTVLEAPA